MAAIEYFLVCSNILQDMMTNEVSLINVLEDIAPEAFPHTIPRAVAISLWNLQPEDASEEYQATVVVKVPGELAVPFPMTIYRKGDRCRAIQSVLGIPLRIAGDLEFEVLLNGRHEASHRVRIHPAGPRGAEEIRAS